MKKNEILNQKSNLPLNNFQEKESDESDFSFDKPSQPNQKPLLQLAPVNVNQGNTQKSQFQRSFCKLQR